MPTVNTDIGDPLYFFGRTTTRLSRKGVRVHPFSHKGFEYIDGGGLGEFACSWIRNRLRPSQNPPRCSSSAPA